MKIALYSPEPWDIPDAPFMESRHQLVRLTGEAGAMLRQLSSRKPDLVFLKGFDPSEIRFRQAVEKLCITLPQAAVVVLHPQTGPELLLQLMQAGVREVVADDLPATIGTVVERAELRTKGSGACPGRVLGFVSSKGGDGSSCTTANLASALSEQPRTRVLAIDVSLPFGDLDMYLTAEKHPKDLADISKESDRLDQSLLESMVHRLSETLDLIPSPSTFEKTVAVEPERVGELIQVATCFYDFVLIDLGSSLDRVGIQVLEHLDDLLVVTTPSLPSLRRAGLLLNLWKAFEKPISQIDIILNRADAEARVTCPEIESVVQRPVGRRFPSDHGAVQESLLAGRPFVELLPRSKLSRAFLDWAAELTGNAPKQPSPWDFLKIR
ncbi:AAA family ATPase [Chlorobium sp. N1]|uniref:AAA family ATPase n=1 Tax=Chlorobium sp. N1 TaxID=2491138 RepID=UPI00104039B7|nr:AAA family ATPase [Chlorobium sp. N1]TCD47225.1 MinD/ParA family protein [Chlorobium sp. N1]